MRALERRTVVSVPLREAARRHIVDLATLAVSIHPEIGESDLESVIAARTAAAIEYINAHFREPNLSLGSAATALRISTRYLQKLFERKETSFTAQVNRMRLDHAHTLLRQGVSLRVSDIAFQSGFSDVSHFNRMFRARFGETPSELRAAPRAQLPGGA
jgi:AraC-like DNA-binding protein